MSKVRLASNSACIAPVTPNTAVKAANSGRWTQRDKLRSVVAFYVRHQIASHQHAEHNVISEGIL